MASSEAGYAGSQGYGFRLVVTGDVLGQEEDNCRSLVRTTAYMKKVAGVVAWNLNATYANIQPNGQLINGAINGYDSRSGSGPWYGFVYDFWVGHNNDGTGSASFYAYHNGQNLPYVGEAATSFSMGLPTLYRYAEPNALWFTNITDVGFTLNVNANRECDQINVSLDGGATWPYQIGGVFTNRTVDIGGVANPLRSGQTYTVRINLRRRVSGLWRETGNWGVTTEQQNKFFDLGDF